MSPSIVAFAASFAIALSLTPELEARQARTAYADEASLETVREWVDRAPTTHPRLLVDVEGLVALRDSVGSGPLRKKIAEVVVLQADALLKEAPIARELQGRRLLSQSRRCVRRVLALSMAYHLTGEEKYISRCEQEMLAVARFEDWNPSHFLDVAEMTFGLAIGYDWLYDELRPEARETIRGAIVEILVLVHQFNLLKFLRGLLLAVAGATQVETRLFDLLTRIEFSELNELSLGEREFRLSLLDRGIGGSLPRVRLQLRLAQLQLREVQLPRQRSTLRDRILLLFFRFLSLLGSGDGLRLAVQGRDGGDREDQTDDRPEHLHGETPSRVFVDA